jgi:hypothetical protein
MQVLVTQTRYKKGDLVAVSGNYVCIPCGYVQYFTAGDRFIECLACLAGTPDGPIGYREDEEEFWELVG